ncbi:ABC transporter substrate-binding protein [Chelatococcus reniformis]|uniref:Branched chain amino acid ABC transporter substrate-binding protein n=1 Tax=Chelatococcus reniformis TaxID=1494448 RepID=A0A916UP81_9HYPH|nr:ABC transporter substrate-binding protein [Chelatococcus reniformis]GGC81518.1 branched chain amino acid ABC transporter substrate-binding protein [Chelatococcus reniformis]
MVLASRLVIALCGMGLTVPAAAADAVRIGIAAPLTGAAATYGQDVQRGADFAAEHINARGGVLGGRKLEIVYEDDKGTPQGGVGAVQKLISVGRVKAITGGTNSSVVLAESSVTKNRILQVNAAAQADAITDQGSPWLFQINNTVSANSKAFNSYIVNAMKPKTVAYMGENTEFNKTVLDNLKESLKAAGIALVNVSTYDAETNDFTSIITKIKSLNPDLLYVSDAYPARAAQLWKQVRQLGGFPKEAMSPGVVTPGMIKPSDGAMNGIYTGEIFMASDPGDEGKAFVEGFEKRYNVEPGKGNLVIYEAVNVIADAMTKAGTDSDYAKIAQVIRDNAWPSPRGELRFDAKGRASAPYFFIQQIKDGKLVQVDRVKSN